MYQFNQELRKLISSVDISADLEKDFIHETPDIINIIAMLRQGMDIEKFQLKLNNAKVTAAMLTELDEYKSQVIAAKSKAARMRQLYDKIDKFDHLLVTEAHHLLEQLYNIEYHAMQKIKVLEKSVIVKLNIKLADLYFQILTSKIIPELDVVEFKEHDLKFQSMEDFFTVELEIDDKIEQLRDFIIRLKIIRNDLKRNSLISGAQRLFDFTQYLVYYLEELIDLKKDQLYYYKDFNNKLSKKLVCHNLDTDSLNQILLKGYMSTDYVEFVSFGSEPESYISIVFPFSTVAKNNLISQHSSELRVWPKTFLGTELFPLNEAVLLIRSEERSWKPYFEWLSKQESWFKRYNIDIHRWIKEHVVFTDEKEISRIRELKTLKYKCLRGCIIPVEQRDSIRLFRFEC